MKSRENDHTVSQEILMDPVLKEQLANMQDDNIKLTITLQSEQHVKKQLAKKLASCREICIS
jgi:HKD family nuclease